jgi:hypothetical protein
MLVTTHEAIGSGGRTNPLAKNQHTASRTERLSARRIHRMVAVGRCGIDAVMRRPMTIIVTPIAIAKVCLVKAEPRAHHIGISKYAHFRNMTYLSPRSRSRSRSRAY